MAGASSRGARARHRAEPTGGAGRPAGPPAGPGGARRLVAVLGAAAVLGTCAVVPASAAPTTPSQAQVDAARQAATSKAGEVSAVQAQLAAAQQALDDAQVAAQQAAEAYNAARVELEARTAAADSARAAAAAAQGGLDTARSEVGRIAAGSYRSGGGLSDLSAYLSAQGPQDLLDRAALLQAVSTQHERTYQQMGAAEAVAQLLQQQAQAALAEQQAAAAAADDARVRAQAASDAATALVGTTQAQTDALVAQLAQLQGTSTALAAQRQEGLAREAQEARDAAARADRERRQAAAAAAARASAGASGGASGGTSGGAGTTNAGGSSGGAGSAPVTSGSSSASSGQAGAALSWARQQIGDPYVWGATGPSSFDCSGLTQSAFRAAGVSIPRVAAAQYAAAKKVSYDDMRPGDLIFYGTDPDAASTVYHVAFYAGGGMMLEAPRTGLDVRLTPVRYGNSMTWAGRP